MEKLVAKFKTGFTVESEDLHFLKAFFTEGEINYDGFEPVKLLPGEELVFRREDESLCMFRRKITDLSCFVVGTITDGIPSEYAISSELKHPVEPCCVDGCGEPSLCFSLNAGGLVCKTHFVLIHGCPEDTVPVGL